MKKIGVIGTIGHIAMGKAVFKVTEQEQANQIDDLRERISNLSESFDSSKCRKGHSYRKVEQEYGKMLPKSKWICKNCQLELK